MMAAMRSIRVEAVDCERPFERAFEVAPIEVAEGLDAEHAVEKTVFVGAWPPDAHFPALVRSHVAEFAPPMIVVPGNELKPARGGPCTCRNSDRCSGIRRSSKSGRSPPGTRRIHRDRYSPAHAAHSGSSDWARSRAKSTSRSNCCGVAFVLRS